MSTYREVDGKRDLILLGEALHKVSREANKAELCSCPDRYNHSAACIWWVAKKLGPDIRKAIDRLDLED